MHFWMLIPNIIFNLQESQCLLVKISKNEYNLLIFCTDFEKIDFLTEGKIKFICCQMRVSMTYDKQGKCLKQRDT